MKTYQIFLASSAELAHERDLVTAAIADFVSLHPEHNISFKVIKWENFAATFEDARKQDQYNDSIGNCNVFLMLFWTKVGKYTKEEYELAAESLKINQKPYLLLLEKKDGYAKDISVTDFKQQVLHGNGLFSAVFKNDDNLKSVIKEELQKLFKDGLLKRGEPANLLSPNGAANPNVFIGRDEELKEIRKRLDNCGKLMLINAEGGIGKTTLAAKYWNESLHDYKHNAWLFCDNGIVNALKELAPKLNLDLVGMDETQQIAALKHALSNIHDDFLLVLDNANDDEDIRVFRQTFEGFHWHVLITSRCQGVLEKEQELPITHLPPPLAKALFLKYYKEDSPEFEVLLDGLLEAIRYHTLLIEIFAKNMLESAELGIKMADFLQKLESEGLHLGKNSFEVKTDYTIAVKANAATTDQILDALYDFGKLKEEQRFLLLNLSLLPAEPYTLQFINSLLANETTRTDLDLRKTLKSLSKKGWIAQTKNIYRLSPVVQDLMLHKNKAVLGTNAEDLLDKLNIIFETDAYNLITISLTEAEPYAKLIFQINKNLEVYPNFDIGSLNLKIGTFFERIGKLELSKNCYQNSLRIFGFLQSKDPDISVLEGTAITHHNLGNLYFEQGELENALAHYGEYFNLQSFFCVWGKNKNDYHKKGLAISYQKLGKTWIELLNFEKAHLYLIKAYELIKNIHENHKEDLQIKHLLALGCLSLSNVCQKMGNLRHAVKYAEECNVLSNQLYEKDSENLQYKNALGNSLENLAVLFEENEDQEYILKLLKVRLEIAMAISSKDSQHLDYKFNLGNSNVRLGWFYLRHNNYQDAMKYFLESKSIFYDILKKSQGNIKMVSYNFSTLCQIISNIAKETILSGGYKLEIIEQVTIQIKQIRQEGYQALKPLAEQGILQANQMNLFTELSDETWYNF